MAKVVSEVASWIEWKTSDVLTGDTLLAESKGYLFRDGSELLVELGQEGEFGHPLPMSLKASYVHDDRKIVSRQWITEVMIKRDPQDIMSECTVNLYVTDSDQRVRKPVLSRPRIVVNIVESCRPVGSTPGLFTKPLSLNTAKKVVGDLLDLDRTRPLILVSSNWSVDPPLNVENIRGQLLGLADIYQVTEETDPWSLANILGSDYSCYGDAIRIIWPIDQGQNVPSSMLLLPKAKGGAPRSSEEMVRLAVLLVLQRGISAG